MFDYHDCPSHLTLQGMEMLVWRMDLLKRTFETLNEFDIGILAEDNYRFFKDSEFRKKLILPQDLASVDNAITLIKQRIPTRSIFRTRSGDKLHWFKLTGWPVSEHRYYEGTVEEISDHISLLQGVFEQRDKNLYSVESNEYPVAIFSKQGNRLIRHNTAFAKLLGIPKSSRKITRLDNLVTAEVKLPSLQERLLLGRKLTESLYLFSAEGRKVRATCSLECFSYRGEDLIRLAVTDVIDTDQRTGPQADKADFGSNLDKLCTRLQGAQSLEEMLDEIYTCKTLLPGLEAIMYSDIYARKNSVYVYARGSLFETLEPGSQYPYSGTIAENIEKENLEYLIVDDTHASIKAIDWALFVPHGVHSYIAKALYVRGAMRTVLIFCSGQKHAFSDEQVSDVAKIATTFHRQLKQFKKR